MCCSTVVARLPIDRDGKKFLSSKSNNSTIVSLQASVTNFINSWAYNAECTDLAVSLPPACQSVSSEVVANATDQCSILTNSTGKPVTIKVIILDGLVS